jgi:drug/metabolite transporter (DMT)-like permease
LADATAIGFTSPIFAMFFAAVLLRESIGARRWVAAFIGLSGALIISSPDGASLSFGAMIALAAAVFMGAEIVGVKWLSQTADHPLTILFYSNLTGALMSLATAAPGWVWPSATQLTLLVSIGLVAVIGQACVLRAARLADANFLAPFFYVSLVYSAAIGFFLFDEKITSPLIIGGTAILVGAFIMLRGGSTASPRS